MKPFAVSATDHHATGKFVNNDDFAVADDVVLVAMEDRFCLERLLEIVCQIDVAVVVDAFPIGDVRQLLDPVNAIFCEGNCLVFQIDLVVAVSAQLSNDLGELVVFVVWTAQLVRK